MLFYMLEVSTLKFHPFCFCVGAISDHDRLPEICEKVPKLNFTYEKGQITD